MRAAVPIEIRFWQQVTKTDGCWTMRGFRYTKIKTARPNPRTLLGHRFSWELHNGPVPIGLCVLHKCNNKLCVRPDHLYLGTCKRNICDAIKDGLKKRWDGPRNPKAKLNLAKVEEIRKSHETEKVLAVKFGVSVSNIDRIRNGHLWIGGAYAAP